MPSVRRISTLTREQSLELLGGSQVGRVVFTDRGLPAVLPVTFVVDRSSVVFRTARGSRLAAGIQDAVVAFEADEVRPASRDGWSVVVVGRSRVEADPLEQDRLDGLLHSWVPGRKDAFVRVPLEVVTGRRLIGGPTPLQPFDPGPGAPLALSRVEAATGDFVRFDPDEPWLG